MPHTVSGDAGLADEGIDYLAFFALNFAHLALCAAAILSRAAAERRCVPRPPLDFPATPLNASIALSNFARSAFNCASTAPRSTIDFRFLLVKVHLPQTDIILNARDRSGVGEGAHIQYSGPASVVGSYGGRRTARADPEKRG